MLVGAKPIDRVHCCQSGYKEELKWADAKL